MPKVNQWRAINTTDGLDAHLYQDTNPHLETYFSASDEGGCCTANNGQGWPKLALRTVYRTPDDNGLAVGAFSPVRVQLSERSVLLVDSDYPFEDTVRVLVTGLGLTSPTSAPTPLRVRIPVWAVRAQAWHNGVELPQHAVRNGTMLKVICAPAILCNVTVATNPTIRLERWYNDSVSVLRGSLLFSLFIGHNFTRYKGHANVPGRAVTPRGPGPTPAEAAWYGATSTMPPNLALVVKDADNPATSFALSTPGLPCTVTPTGANWPHCALLTPATCVRSCAAPFNHTGWPLYLTATARQVMRWGFANRTKLEAAPPPHSPACAGATDKNVVCGDPVAVILVPHGATDLRVGSMPLA